MRHRKLGNTEFNLSVIGLGTWAIGGGDWKFGWGQQDEQDAVAAVVQAVPCGVNWIDTAPVYGDGRSEMLVGRALAEIASADRPLIATKFGRLIQPDGSVKAVIKPESIREECEASLRRLGVETIDLYQMHWPQPDEDIEAAWETMAALKKAGKVREIGVSNFSASQLQRIDGIAPCASLQPPYHLLRRGAEQDLLPFCAERQIGVVAYSSMGKGLLTGKYTSERAANLPADDHRSRDPDFAPPRLSIHLALIDKLQQIASEAGRTMAQLAIAWVLRRPEVTSAIVGARNPQQIEQTAPAGDWELSPDEQDAIDRLVQEHDRQLAAAT